MVISITCPEAKGNNKVTEEVTPKVAADKPIRFHSAGELAQAYKGVLRITEHRLLVSWFVF
jgi:hypothetical protein